jgi:integrase
LAKDRKDIAWSSEQSAAFLDSCCRVARQAFVLSRYSALREVDICLLELGVNFDGEWIILKPQKTIKKTGVTVYIPVFAIPPLVDLFEELPKTGRLLVSDRGANMTTTNLRRLINDGKIAAGLAGQNIHFHDVRGMLINSLLDAGATDAEVRSVSGHSLKDKGGLGAYATATPQLAFAGFRKWLAARARESAGSSNVVTFPGR